MNYFGTRFSNNILIIVDKYELLIEMSVKQNLSYKSNTFVCIECELNHFDLYNIKFTKGSVSSDLSRNESLSFLQNIFNQIFTISIFTVSDDS